MFTIFRRNLLPILNALLPIDEPNEATLLITFVRKLQILEGNCDTKLMMLLKNCEPISRAFCPMLAPNSATFIIVVPKNSKYLIGIIATNSSIILIAFGKVFVKNPPIALTTVLVTDFMPSHRPIQKFLKLSDVFHNVTNAATRPAIAPTIKPIGLAIIVRFSAVCPAFASIIASFIFLNAPITVIMPDTALNIPIAVTIPVIADAIRGALSFSHCNLSITGFNSGNCTFSSGTTSFHISLTASDIPFTISRILGSEFFIAVIRESAKLLINCPMF